MTIAQFLYASSALQNCILRVLKLKKKRNILFNFQIAIMVLCEFQIQFEIEVFQI